MEKGIRNTVETVVTDANTAVKMGSGNLRVFATPAMIALIEETAWKSVAPFLEDGQGTVGISLDIKHTAPTPVGMTVRCETVLTGIDGRKLTFETNVYDEKGQIGNGTHERFIINSEKFQTKADCKKEE